MKAIKLAFFSLAMAAIVWMAALVLSNKEEDFLFIALAVFVTAFILAVIKPQRYHM